MCLTSWAEKLGISYYTLKERLRRGWTDEEAITGRRAKTLS
jgi:hypothetical protein